MEAIFDHLQVATYFRYICVCVEMDLIINFFDIDSTNIDLIYEGW